MNVKPGDLAIILKGRWPNVGRIVYVSQDYGAVDYSHLGLGMQPSWWVESLSSKPLDSLCGPVHAGHTPNISLRRLDVPPEHGQALRREKAMTDFEAAKRELLTILQKHEAHKKEVVTLE